MSASSSSDGDVYEVEAILAHRYRKNRIEYRIRWMNYGSDDDTWEKEENLDGCPDLLRDYKSALGLNSKRGQQQQRRQPRECHRDRRKPADPESQQDIVRRALIDDLFDKETSSSASLTPPPSNASNVMMDVDDSECPTTRYDREEEEDDDVVEVLDTTIQQQGTQTTAAATPADDVQKVVPVMGGADDDDDIVMVSTTVCPSDRTTTSSTTNVRQRPSMRAAKFPCTICSKAFMTNRAYEEHLRTHQFDASGDACEAEYGIPFDRLLHLCLVCCYAFESPERYLRHMSKHDENYMMPCSLCSGISYATELTEKHMEMHNLPRTVPRRLLYGCSFCRITFDSDARLHEHLMEKHQCALIFFCKGCRLAHANPQIVLRHLLESAECLKRVKCTAVDSSILMCLGSAAAGLFHFQPTDEPAHVQALAAGAVVVAKPSICSHRSMNVTTESTMTCRDCCYSLSMAAYQSIESPTEAVNLDATDYGDRRPFAGFLHQVYQSMMANISQVYSSQKVL